MSRRCPPHEPRCIVVIRFHAPHCSCAQQIARAEFSMSHARFAFELLLLKARVHLLTLVLAADRPSAIAVRIAVAVILFTTRVLKEGL
jgi:hypothetical protein